MPVTSDVYILITVQLQPDALKNVAQQLKKIGFDVRDTSGVNSPCDLIIFFNASGEKLTDVYRRIKNINGVATICILPAFPV